MTQRRLNSGSIDFDPMSSPGIQHQIELNSTKKLVVSIGTVITSIGLVGLLWYIVLTVFHTVDKEVLEIVSIIVVVGIALAIVLAAVLGVVLIFRRLAQPGIQGRGVVAKIEKELGLD